MMYRHGLRCSEAVDLRIEDVSFDRATLWVRRLEGSNSGMHPIEGDELRAIRRYLALMGCGVAGEGNPSTDDGRLHPDHRPNVAKCLWLGIALEPPSRL